MKKILLIASLIFAISLTGCKEAPDEIVYGDIVEDTIEATQEIIQEPEEPVESEIIPEVSEEPSEEPSEEVIVQH